MAFATRPIDGKEYGKVDDTQGIAGGAKICVGRGIIVVLHHKED